MRAMQDLTKGSKFSHHHGKRLLFSSLLLVFPFSFCGYLVFLGLTGCTAHQWGDLYPQRSRSAPAARGESHVAARRAPSKVSLAPAAAGGIWAFLLRQEVSGRESVPGGARLSRRPWGRQAAAGRLSL